MRLLLLSLLCMVPLAAQSLMTARTLQEGTLYADPLARRVGDLLTIKIQENTLVRESQETETSRSNTASIGGSFSQPSDEEATDLHSLSLNTSNTFTGEGDYAQSGEIKATITGRVIDVLANGNLVIEARRQLSFNNDTKTIVISGIVRYDDVRSDNSVLSEKIHNFQVGIDGEGPLTRAQQRGFLGRLLDLIWPF